MHSYEQAAAYVTALTGQPADTSPMWWRCIHDVDKQAAAHKYYGTLAQVWSTLVDYNNRGYGIFANINAFVPPRDGLQLHENPHNLADVWYVRTHVVDLDNVLTAATNYTRATMFQPAPSFAVVTSPGKSHIYWPVQPYQGNDRSTILQRKLRQFFDGDKSVIDPTRVLRVPGFYHLKNPAQPHLVTCHALPGYGVPGTVEALEAATAHVNVIDGAGGRHELGDASLAAPSLDWLRFGLSQIDPNQLDRGEWISLTAAIKQAGWTLADEPTLRGIWEEWCARYGDNDAGENDKQWRSIRDTEVGWNSIKRRAPTLLAYEKFGFKQPAPAPIPVPAPQPDRPQQPVPDEQFGPILSEYECARYFANCLLVERLGKILTPQGRFLDPNKFNAKYGGHAFVIDNNGKTTDEPWKAATRSQLWTVPKVDHIRFMPELPTFTIVEDQLGRLGVNTYIPIKLKHRPGDVTPFLRHMETMLPVESDRHTFLSYLAHNVKYPGYKIPWAPMLQSAEGVGKGFIQEVIEGMLGEMYTYSPPAEELVKSGSTFNSWQRGKLMIVVNEIKIDERRELIEILKPQISDKRVQIQSKGVDQEMEDNPANWVFFSNYKDAIPISASGRRYCIFYSVIQSKADLLARGMDDRYFQWLFHWLRECGGLEFVIDWLINYPIERGAIPMRAPETSSHAEAVKVSRGPIEIAIHNAIEDGLSGFRGGYVSLLAVMNRLKALGGRTPATRTVSTILEQMGFVELGRASRQYSQESMSEKTVVFAKHRELPIGFYGMTQGYE